jgi:hypothetical protein
VEAALTGDPLDYAASFGVVEDRGVGPRTVLNDPAVTGEYAVVVDAQIEVDRVRAKLEKAGLLKPAAAAQAPPVRTVDLVLEDVASWHTLAIVRGALVEKLGARSVVPREFAPGRAVLRVTSPRDAQTLLADLPPALPDGLRIEPLGSEGGQARARVRMDAAPASAAAPSP